MTSDALLSLFILLVMLRLSLELDVQGPASTGICSWAQFQVRSSNLYERRINVGERTSPSQGYLDVAPTRVSSNKQLFMLHLNESWNEREDTVRNLIFTKENTSYSSTNFEDGAMLSSTNGILLYGGLARPTEYESIPGPQNLLGFDVCNKYTECSDKDPAFFNLSLPIHITRYVSNGASVSAPSENMGYYFSGQRGENWGPITSDNASANVSAAAMIAVNTSDGSNIRWHNETLPPMIVPRANAELVWIPVSQQGILAVIGGTFNPEGIYPAGLSDRQKHENARYNPGFLATIPIYDIKEKAWFLQNTTGDIPPAGRAKFCSVLASAKDNSSHNIYIYGGHNGQDGEQVPYDDVYILSIPSFIWTKAYNGSAGHGRSGHKCFRVLPDQMVVVGGSYRDPSFCLDSGIIQLFNMNDLRFQEYYSPSEWKDYTVPKIVTERIGGSGYGGARTTKPPVWIDSHLADAFSTPYPRPVPVWYPYNTSSVNHTATDNQASEYASKTSFWRMAVGIGISTPIGIGVLSVGCVWFYRRFKEGPKLGYGVSSPCGRWITRILNSLYGSRVVEADSTAVPRETSIRVRSVGGLAELDAHSVCLEAATHPIVDELDRPLSLTATPPEMRG